METLLTQREAATVLRLGERTLERLRMTGLGPRYVKLNRRVAYQQCDLDEWVAGRLRHSTSETALAQGRAVR